jgi:hypothetical protein
MHELAMADVDHPLPLLVLRLNSQRNDGLVAVADLDLEYTFASGSRDRSEVS